MTASTGVLTNLVARAERWSAARATSAHWRWLPIEARFGPPMPLAKLSSQYFEDAVG
jgi:hypothetical protein